MSVFVITVVPLNDKFWCLQCVGCFVIVVDVSEYNTQEVKDWHFSFKQKGLYVGTSTNLLDGPMKIDYEIAIDKEYSPVPGRTKAATLLGY